MAIFGYDEFRDGLRTLMRAFDRYWRHFVQFALWVGRVLWGLGSDLFDVFARWFRFALAARNAPRVLGRPIIANVAFRLRRHRNRAVVSRGYFRNFSKLATA